MEISLDTTISPYGEGQAHCQEPWQLNQQIDAASRVNLQLSGKILLVDDGDLVIPPSHGYRSHVIVATRGLCSPDVVVRAAFIAAI